MLHPARPDNEAERRAALRRYRILDIPRDDGFDDQVAIAVTICDVPMGSVTPIDAERQRFRSSRARRA